MSTPCASARATFQVAMAGGLGVLFGRAFCIGHLVNAARGTPTKTYDIDMLRLKSLRHGRGLIEIGIDAQGARRPARDDDSGGRRLQLRVDQARSLLLLKQQLVELDRQLPRSRRSGRC